MDVDRQPKPIDSTGITIAVIRNKVNFCWTKVRVLINFKFCLIAFKQMVYRIPVFVSCKQSIALNLPMLEPVLSADSFVDNTLNDTICQWFQCWNQYLDRSSW